MTKRFGGSKATVYGYFPSKEALFVAVVENIATAHLSEAVAELRVKAEKEVTLETLLLRFGEQMLQVLTHDASALAVYRMVDSEAGKSDVGQLFYESGPAQCVDTLAGLLAAAMKRGELRQLDPQVTAHQLLGLLTAETQVRLYQVDPPKLSPGQIRLMVRRAVDVFLMGSAPR